MLISLLTKKPSSFQGSYKETLGNFRRNSCVTKTRKCSSPKNLPAKVAGTSFIRKNSHPLSLSPEIGAPFRTLEGRITLEFLMNFCNASLHSKRWTNAWRTSVWMSNTLRYLPNQTKKIFRPATGCQQVTASLTRSRLNSDMIDQVLAKTIHHHRWLNSKEKTNDRCHSWICACPDIENRHFYCDPRNSVEYEFRRRNFFPSRLKTANLLERRQAQKH